jgi:squalene-hopene/tetraprenyl-beta-curcumene cyclase
MMLDALYDAGLSPSEPAFQRALIFASRTQNLKATNPSPWVDEREKPGGDGGFVYTPANGGESFGSDASGEGRYGEKLVAAGEQRSLRSYGSMTYAGFKSMVYAGLSQDDVRVQAALDWLRRHWTFDENPGLGQQGLYYYYHTLSRALYVSQLHTIADDKGVEHNWRSELIAALLKRQRDDGSWVNEADRWMEGDPVLVTTYAVLALEEAIKPVIANQ